MAGITALRRSSVVPVMATATTVRRTTPRRSFTARASAQACRSVTPAFGRLFLIRNGDAAAVGYPAFVISSQAGQKEHSLKPAFPSTEYIPILI
jgi:hypothetical protein